MSAHPLDPLSEDEFRATAAALRRDRGVSDGWRFASIELAEPPKVEVKAWRRGDPIVRRSLSVLWEKATNKVYEVDLTAFLQAEFAAGRKVVTLVLKNASTSDAQTIFGSDESAMPPQLVVS